MTAVPPKRRAVRRRMFHPLRFCACVFAAALITVAIVAATAVWVPFVRPQPPQNESILIGGAYPTFQSVDSLRQRITLWTATHEQVEVATWGDHLQPWHIRISTPFASRLTWFEKGRVYNRSDVVAPGGASTAAVSCWSFATGCWSVVNNQLTGKIPAPPELTKSNEERKTWATAIEQRGWPFHAFSCRISAPMGRREDPVYTVDGGVWASTTDAPIYGGEIQTLPVIPTTPIWSGLIADIIVVAPVLYGLSFVPGFVIRRLRTHKGRCPECGYNLRGQPAGTPGCPECGWNRSTPSPENAPPSPN